MYKAHDLETHIREKRKEKELLLMTHIVLGYPDFDACFDLVEQMVEAGVDLMELQIPFSEPMADGPVILKANQAALDRGATLERCLAFAERAAATFPIPFLFMGYANTFYRFGMDRMAREMADRRIAGAIIPDLPPEESGMDPNRPGSPARPLGPDQDYLGAMERHSRAPIHIFTPQTPEKRMVFLDAHSSGFIYCTARKGVTGKETAFSQDLSQYLETCRNNTRLPIAVGFGLKEKKDMDFLRGKADIAVIGSETIRQMEAGGTQKAGAFIRALVQD